VRFKEGYERGEQARLICPAAKLACPDSGQVEEPLRAAFVGERRRERGKGESIGIVWRL